VASTAPDFKKCRRVTGAVEAEEEGLDWEFMARTRHHASMSKGDTSELRGGRISPNSAV
jgi:hypothetical protein